MYNSRPVPQTSAHQLTFEFIARFIIVVTENYSDIKVSAALRSRKQMYQAQHCKIEESMIKSRKCVFLNLSRAEYYDAYVTVWKVDCTDIR